MRGLRDQRFWLACAAGCVLLASTEATALHFDALRAGRVSRLGPLLVERLLADAVWLAVAPAVFAVSARAIAAGVGAARAALRLAIVGVALAPFYTTSGAVAYALVHTGGLAPLRELVFKTALTTFMWDAFLYSMLALACGSLLLARRSKRQEQEKSELRARLAHAELELLRAQLEPHFLFNALHTIAGLVRGARHEAATSALAQLSELLRYVVEASRQERVPLAWELEFASNYLKLQQVRFGPRLRFAIHGDAAARRCDVPPLLLQPLIENAVVHGAARTGAPADVEVRVAVLADAALSVEVRNTRDAGAPPAPTTGVGLSNTRQRLQRMYGGDFRLEAGPDGARGYRVAISLPRAEEGA